jgi:hypothetical protein
MFEVLWFAFAAILVFVILASVRTTISPAFYRFLFITGFIFVTYLRLAVWARNSILLSSIVIKLVLFFGNVALFFFLLHEFNVFRQAFDDYNFTLPEGQFQQIRSGTDVDQVMKISRLTSIAGTGAILSVVLLELRLMWMIFRSRQLERLVKS